MRASLLWVFVAGCGSDAVLAPIFDVPAAGSAAYPYTDLDSLNFAVARSGDDANLREGTFARGEDPVLPSVPFGDDLVLHVSGRQSDIEVAYGRSCVLSVAEGSVPDAPHVYFSRIVKWAAAPTPSAPARAHAAAWTTPDGRAVFVGGDAGETSIERFNPGDGAFALLAGTSAARTGAVVAPLADGKALRIGGVAGDAPVGFFELIGPLAAGTQVETVADDRVLLVDHTASTLVDDTVVVIGGRLGAERAVTGATWLFGLGDAGTPDTPRLLPATLTTPRAQHTATRLGDDVGAAVLVIGGRDAAGAPVAAAERFYEPLREGYADFHPAMVTPRYDHRAVLLPDGSVLVIGGRDAAGAAVATVELYSARVGRFTTAATLPASAGLTDFTATPLPDGRVLLAGGRNAAGDLVATTLIARLDPLDGTVDLSQTDSLSAPRAGHAAARLCDGTVLVVGGDAAVSAERYNPPSTGRR